MPRLAARSNGCITCKRRKVKCDETKPSCERCKKAYMHCDGYRKLESTIWISENVRFENWHRRHPDSAQYVSSLSNNTSSAVTSFYLADFTRIIRTPSSALDISAKTEDVWICYLSTELLPGTNYSNIGKPVRSSWILDLLDWDCDSIAYYTVCCISSAYWAKTHNAIQISKVSGNYYMKALRQLRINISNDSMGHHPTNVASAFLLGLYELIMFEPRHGWLQHAGGVGSLIFRRGPEAHMTDPARFYYQTSRLPMISRSLFLRKRTFLERPEWQVISSTIESPRGRSMYRLMDIMARIPGLLEDNDALRKPVSGCPSAFCRRLLSRSNITNNDNDDASPAGEWRIRFEEKVVEIRQKTTSLLSELFEWRLQFHELYPQLAYEVIVDPTTSQTLTDDGFPLFDTVIRYRDYHRGRQVVLYNTALLMILYLVQYWRVEDGVAQALHMLSTSATYSASSLEAHQTCLILPHHNIKSSDASTELVRSIEYFLQGTLRINGAMNMILPFRTLMDRLEYGSDERIFVRKVMFRMGVGQGFGFVQQFQNYTRFQGELNLCSCKV